MRDRIIAALAGTTPADDPVATAMAGNLPDCLRRLIKPKSLVPAAVLMPLVEGPTAIDVILTQRAGHLKHHAGQISFPGGRLEDQDDGPVDTALRESQEEIGLDRGHVKVVGFLDPYITITGYVVTPVVGFVGEGFSLQADNVEVEEIFMAPMKFLLDPANWMKRQRDFMGVPVTYYEIAWENRNIWGATAAMLIGFSEILNKNK